MSQSDLVLSHSAAASSLDGVVVGAEILAHKSVLASGCAFFYAQFTSEFLASGEEQNSAAKEALIMDPRVRRDARVGMRASVHVRACVFQMRTFVKAGLYSARTTTQLLSLRGGCEM